MKASRSLLPILLVAHLACGASDSSSIPSGDAGPEALPDGAAVVDGSDAGASNALADLDRAIDAARNAGDSPSLAFSLYDRNDALVFTKSYGDFAPSRRVAVASSSKIVAGLVVFALIGQGKLSLDTTTGTALGWPGTKGDITLRHLLSFTSGLQPEAACTLNPAITLEACVGTIASADPLAPPGQRYDYGSTHLHVAARMAEVASGKSWNTLFAEIVQGPLGLPAEVTYFTAPKQQIGKTNPLIAGGLRTSMDEYAKILSVIFHEGRYGSTSVAPSALFVEQTKEPFPSVTIGNSPMAKAGQPARYGLTAWLECTTPATGCSVISSPGAFGFTPWLDRDVGYYAIIGMEGNGTASQGVVAFSVSLEQDLKPIIARVFGR